MLKVKKVISFLMAMTMVAAMFAGCGTADKKPDSLPGSSGTQTDASAQSEEVIENFNPTGMPIAKEKVTLKVFAGKNPLQVDYAKMPMWEEYEKLTGVHIEWDLADMATMAERKNILLNSGDYPDVFFKQGLTEADLVSYGPDQKVFIPLDDLIEKYGTYYKEIAKEYPESNKSIRLYDGKIYSLPNIAGMDSSVGCYYFMNQKWLDAVGMKVPTTLDEYYDTLVAFRDKDPNGNGKKDEIPILSSNWGITGFVHYIKASWGLGNRGRDFYFDVDESTGKVRYTAATPEFKEVLEYTSRLYAEKLLNQEIFTIGDNLVTVKGEEGVAGSFIYQNPILIGKKHQEDYVAVTDPLKNTKTDITPIYNMCGPNVTNKAAFVITNSCKTPEIAFRWGEYFYSDEGQALFWMGVEDLTYTKNEKGECIPTDLILNNPDGLTVDEATGKYFARFMGGPTVKKLKYAYGHGDAIPVVLDAAEAIKPYKPTEVWAPFNFNSEDSARYNAMKADINTYCDEMVSKFVSGKAPISEFDNFVATLNKMGLEEYVEIYQRGYDTFKS